MASLSARHTLAATTAQADQSQLAVIVEVMTGAKARHCAFFVTNVVEVMRPLPIESLANMPPFVLGLSLIRGAATPVLDAAALLGETSPVENAAADRARARTSRFVVLRVGERRVALAVASVLGVRPLAGETLQALPPLLRHASEQVVAAIGTIDAQLLTVLGDGYLVPPALWERLASVKAPA